MDSRVKPGNDEMERGANRRSGRASAADEADDILGLGQDRIGDGVSAARAVGEDAVDLDRVGHQALHLIADRGQPRGGKLGQGVLKAREGRIAEFAQDVLSARLGETGIDADEIGGLGPITTEILPAPEFYFAEDYHQQYLAKNPRGYCGLGGTGVSCPIGTGVGA